MCRIYQVITLSKVNKKNQYLNKYGEKWMFYMFVIDIYLYWRWNNQVSC